MCNQTLDRRSRIRIVAFKRSVIMEHSIFTIFHFLSLGSRNDSIPFDLKYLDYRQGHSQTILASTHLQGPRQTLELKSTRGNTQDESFLEDPTHHLLILNSNKRTYEIFQRQTNTICVDIVRYLSQSNISYNRDRILGFKTSQELASS